MWSGVVVGLQEVRQELGAGLGSGILACPAAAGGREGDIGAGRGGAGREEPLCSLLTQFTKTFVVKWTIFVSCTTVN